MKNKNKLLTEFVRYGALNVLGMLGLSCYILADTFFISMALGADGLTALNLAIPFYSLIHGSGLMLGMGGAIRYAVFKSRGKQPEGDSLFTNSVYLAVFLAAAFIMAGCFFSESLAVLSGADGVTFAMTNTYIKVIFLFAPAFLMNDILLCFVRNDGSPRLAMAAMLGGSLSNVLLDYIFLFPLDLGILGAVLATGLAPLISMAILSRRWIKKSNGFHLRKKRPEPRICRSILTLGCPSLIAEACSGIVIVVFNFIILGLRGNAGVAAYGVIANLSLVASAVYTGLAQGMQPLVSRAWGGRDRMGMDKLLRYALTAVLILSCIIYAVVFFFAEPVAAAFNSGRDPQLGELAAPGLRLYFTAVLFMGFNIVLSAFFAAAEKAVPAQAVALLRGILLIVPAAFLLSSVLGITGVWLASPVAEASVAVLVVGMFAVWKREIRKTGLPQQEAWYDE